MENKLTDVVIRRKLHEDSNTLPIKIILLIGDKTEFLKNRKKKNGEESVDLIHFNQTVSCRLLPLLSSKR